MGKIQSTILKFRVNAGGATEAEKEPDVGAGAGGGGGFVRAAVI